MFFVVVAMVVVESVVNVILRLLRSICCQKEGNRQRRGPHSVTCMRTADADMGRGIIITNCVEWGWAWDAMTKTNSPTT